MLLDNCFYSKELTCSNYSKYTPNNIQGSKKKTRGCNKLDNHWWIATQEPEWITLIVKIEVIQINQNKFYPSIYYTII